MIRRASIALSITAAVAATFAASAFAGSLPAANSGTISVYVPGATGAAATTPKFQGFVAVATTGAERVKTPFVAVSCYQGGQLVYGEVGAPTTTFKLGSNWSPWLEKGGGAANCTAQLYYILNAKKTGEWNGNGAQGGFVILASTPFEAAA